MEVDPKSSYHNGLTPNGGENEAPDVIIIKDREEVKEGEVSGMRGGEDVSF